MAMPDETRVDPLTESPDGAFIPLQQNETSLGYATVRVEIGF